MVVFFAHGYSALTRGPARAPETRTGARGADSRAVEDRCHAAMGLPSVSGCQADGGTRGAVLYRSRLFLAALGPARAPETRTGSRGADSRAVVDRCRAAMGLPSVSGCHADGPCNGTVSRPARAERATARRPVRAPPRRPARQRGIAVSEKNPKTHDRGTRDRYLRSSPARIARATCRPACGRPRPSPRGCAGARARRRPWHRAGRAP